MSWRLLRKADWASGDGWNGKFEGADAGVGVSFLFNEVSDAGKGPPLHKHPYDEVYIVRQGQAHVIVGDDTTEVTVGDILIIPAGTAHKVLTAGSGPTEIISVQLSGKLEVQFLE